MKPNCEVLSELLGSRVSVTRVDSVPGGCISDASKVDLADGTRLFVKSNTLSFLSNFQAEHDGLAALCSATQHVDELRSFKPIAVGKAAEHAWLVTDWVESTSVEDAAFESFGRGLAKLHRSTLGSQSGWSRDNFLGSAAQKNSNSDHWCEFFADQRLGFQIRWAADQGLADQKLKTQCEQIIEQLPRILHGRENPTSLLHGDLWSGNYLFDTSGKTVLIDPAVYRGCREAEMGMLRLFGSCPDRFYHAYQDEFPLPGGWQRRVRVYVLYHLLNHLNLFGLGYLGQCHQLAEQICTAHSGGAH